jgi:hypothetical protein
MLSNAFKCFSRNCTIPLESSDGWVASKLSSRLGNICVSHILVIDDDNDLCFILHEVRRAEGYKVSVAADGAQGIALQRKRPASLLITDILNPIRRALRQSETSAKNSPVYQSLLFRAGGGCRVKAAFSMPRNSALR